METKETKKKREGKKSRGMSAGVIIACCFVIALFIYLFILGKPTNFLGIDQKVLDQQGFWGNLSAAFMDGTIGHPANALGTVYKGGVVVTIIMTLLFTVLALSVERGFALAKARGKGVS